MIRSDILRGHIDSIILKILSEGDSYGYEIAKEMAFQTKDAFKIKEGTLYAAFQRLEKKELIDSYEGERTHGGKRKYYRITSLGKAYLNEMVTEWQEIKAIINVFLGEEK